MFLIDATSIVTYVAISEHVLLLLYWLDRIHDSLSNTTADD